MSPTEGAVNLRGAPWRYGNLSSLLSEAQYRDLRAGLVQVLQERPKLEIGSSGIHNDEAQRGIAGGE
jgi:hypothetical protein